MIKNIFISFLLILLLSTDSKSQTNYSSSKKVSYISDAIYDISDDIIKLIDGSVWLLEGISIALPMSDIIIVLDETLQSGVAYTDGDELLVTHVKGDFIYNSGFLTTVIKEIGNGTLLQTEDGSYWEVPEYDRYDSGYWLPPYKVLITSNELYLINLKKGKKIWVTKTE